MGICSCLLSLLLLLFISQTQYIAAQGKSVIKHPDVAKVGGDEVTVSSAMMIGSIPPSCERRCSSCGHCEAVQVPIAPNERHFFFLRSKNSVISRSEDTSNYKPMSWKCKCGERILNP